MCEAEEFRRRLEAAAGDAQEADVEVVTAGRRRIPAHSSVLASASPVMETMIRRHRAQSGGSGGGDAGRAVVRIRGVADEAAAAFVRLLYTGRRAKGEEEEDMEEYGMQMLVLSHVYQVPWLKRRCEEALASRLTAATVVDVLQLARQCDAPQLRVRCMKLVAKDFAAVETTEAWRFLRLHDPWQELEILQHLHDAHMRKRRWRRKRAEQGVYMELNEAMECLRHICSEGCTEVGPLGQAPASSPCRRYATCHGLQLLIRHFSRCHRKKSCSRCRRMWQLLRLHSALCHAPICPIPLCTQFKSKEQEREAAQAEVGSGSGDDDDKWGLLVKKVMIARVMASLDKRKQDASSQG